MNAHVCDDANTRSPALPMLLNRYIVGQITDASWQRVMNLLDVPDATSQERLALAAFFRDAIVELGADSVKIPKRGEVESLLDVTRSMS